MTESELSADTKYLKGHCLAKLPMAESAVAMLYSRARRSAAKSYADLAMSHERLRAEVSGSEILIAELEKRIESMNEVLGKVRMTVARDEIGEELYGEMDAVMTREYRE